MLYPASYTCTNPHCSDIFPTSFQNSFVNFYETFWLMFSLAFILLEAVSACFAPATPKFDGSEVSGVFWCRAPSSYPLSLPEIRRPSCFWARLLTFPSHFLFGFLLFLTRKKMSKGQIRPLAAVMWCLCFCEVICEPATSLSMKRSLFNLRIKFPPSFII